MDIQILHLSESAKKAQGLAVIIDVFRAFSVACYVFDRGAAKTIAVREVGHARQLKQQNPNWIVIGERHGIKLPGFDFGNSPTELIDASFVGKTVIQTTHAGTQNLCSALNADDVLTGSFLNAGAVIDYIRRKNPSMLSLVCAGIENERESIEDRLCAEYIRDSIGDTPRSFVDIKEELREAKTSQRFFDPERHDSPESDFPLCLELDKFNFTIHRTAVDKHNSCELQRSSL